MNPEIKILAEYIGGVYHSAADVLAPGRTIEYYKFPGHPTRPGVDQTRYAYKFSPSELEVHFSTSWDWFMVAYKKFSEELSAIPRPSKNHCCKADMLEVDIHCFVREFDLQKAAAALADAIPHLLDFKMELGV